MYANEHTWHVFDGAVHGVLILDLILDLHTVTCCGDIGLAHRLRAVVPLSMAQVAQVPHGRHAGDVTEANQRVCRCACACACTCSIVRLGTSYRAGAVVVTIVGAILGI